MQSDEGETRVLGSVKWFDPGKGFGFVVADDGGRDILLHANVLRNFGQSSVADGARVEISVQETPRGFQATCVHMIEPPSSDTTPPLADFEAMDPETLASAELEPARVKWFDKSKGFGFANVFGSAEDVFIHVEVLRRSGLADLLPGEAIVLRVVQGKRGRMATEINSWESAVELHNA
ncbi:Cold shock protein CspV [Roseivivax sp. THAF40]|uniref:cold-shock protein n=1 Tax=unclassified Roseivivax TaxID=2639302 RepID=UPI001267D380|nr:MULTISPECIES: cold shock domain-containing protein [unclassified Roseivivax]QFS83213.1 Cold shock protein CspV [Roseivivax sp. THAF197b]QFT46957.1 Cold shock protein CspV [Roseivivax sp. THAF40]